MDKLIEQRQLLTKKYNNLVQLSKQINKKLDNLEIEIKRLDNKIKEPATSTDTQVNWTE